LRGLKFRRQMPIRGFIADFACVEARLVVEVDGGQHAEMVEADRLRSDAIESAGFLVIRFWNTDVIKNIDGVVREIENVVGTGPVAAN
jgi:very-short-patch-repair endonuclease